MFNLRQLGVLILILILASASHTWAGDRAHNSGFLLRLSGGLGGARSELDSQDAELEGTTGDLNIALGGVVSPNLALHGTLWGWSMSNPDVTIGTQSGTLNGDVTFSAIGIGLTYYFMPSNFYLSGSLGAGKLSLDGNGFSGDSDVGPALAIDLGKEWWVGSSWGLGIALGLGAHAVPDGGVDDSWGGGNVALRFTATYN